jgi:hypothetical protein
MVSRRLGQLPEAGSVSYPNAPAEEGQRKLWCEPQTRPPAKGGAGNRARGIGCARPWEVSGERYRARSRRA